MEPKKVIVKNFHTLSGEAPTSGSQYTGTISSFGYPSVMKQVHRNLKQMINRVPNQDIEGNKARDMLIATISSMRTLEESVIQSICDALAVASAKQEMLENKINAMTPADFIVESDFATPDKDRLKVVTSELLKEDRERFAKVVANPKQPNNEWDALDLD